MLSTFTVQSLGGFDPAIVASVLALALVGIYIIMLGWKTAFRLAVKTWNGLIGRGSGGVDAEFEINGKKYRDSDIPF